jgi:hypothetical protein
MDTRPRHPSYAVDTNATDPVSALHSNKLIAESRDHCLTLLPLDVYYNAFHIRPPGIVAGDMFALLEHLIQLASMP